MSHPTGAPHSTPPQLAADRGRAGRIGDLLVRLGGADLAVLERAPAARVRSNFLQMALVLLSTAGLAVLSMSFALTDGLRLNVIVAVLCGLVWGFVILNLDRMLILNMNVRGGFRRTALMVAPRLLIAVLLGVVISTPLVLRVFQSEITAHVAERNVDRNVALKDQVNNTADAVELAETQAEIKKREDILKGNVEGVTTPEVDDLTRRLSAAKEDLKSKLNRTETARASWQCEVYAEKCQGSTGVSGNGTQAKVREADYLSAKNLSDQAQQTVQGLQTELSDAQNAARADLAQKVADEQAKARADLPDLQEKARQLEAKVNTDRGTGNLIRDDTGLLAQITALHDLAAQNVTALLAYLAVGLLFFMIELLPVLVKILTGLGPPSVYDRIREMDDNELVSGAKARQRTESKLRDEIERRDAAETKKLQAIEDDMRAREQGLGVKANKHVEGEMEKILDVALAHWSMDVRRTLQATGGSVRPTSANGALPSNGAPPANGAPPPAANGAQETVPVPAQVTVLSRFNLPDGDKL